MDGNEDSIETLRVLGKKYSAEILKASDEAASAQELSEELEVPIATCYRRIEELSGSGLLELEDSVLSDEHRRVDVYRRGVEEISIGFEDDDLSVSIEERSQVKNKLDDAWRRLSDST